MDNLTPVVPDKQRAALVSMLASMGLAGGKLVAALFTGSLGILSEAIHSLIDFGATVITWFAVRWSDIPADDDHHYGHAKIESIAALVETALLYLTSAWIIYEAIRRLMGEPHPVEITWWAVATVAASILIDFNRSRALKRVADATASQALEADALHFSSDMWSSLVVLFGLGAVWAGVPMADSLAAIVVSGFILHAGWELGGRTMATLLDRAPDGTTEEIRTMAENESGVLRVAQLRIRPGGPTLFVSLVVEVPRTMPVDSMVKLKEALTAGVLRLHPRADVLVTTNPVAIDSETVFDKISLIASRRGTSIHHLTVQQIGDRLAVSFDLEVDGGTPLDEAHELATGLERAVRLELGTEVEVETHIEPQPVRLLAGHAAPSATVAAVERKLRSLAKGAKRMSDVHNVRIRSIEDGLFVHYHCRFAPTERVDYVHATVDGLEDALRTAFPEIVRVIAHAEPVGRAQHEL